MWQYRHKQSDAGSGHQIVIWCKTPKCGSSFPFRRTDVSFMMPSAAAHISITSSGKEALGDASFGVTRNFVVFTAQSEI